MKPRLRPLSRVWFSTLGVAVIAVAAAFCSPVRADESFDTAETTWSLAGADCQARLAVHERTFSRAHQGQGSEFIALRAAAGGSYAYLLHPVGPGRVIDELEISVWVFADRPGVQLAARVVLPRTIDPRTEAPLSMLLFGESLDEAGDWRRMRLAKTPALLDSQIRVLRSRLPNMRIDVREAYIDAVVLNAYAGAGLTQLWIDDLVFSGGVAAPKFSPVAPADFEAPAGGAVPSNASPRLRGTVLEAGGRPLAPRIIEYRGEAFEWLKSLGFNTIALARPPTAEQCAQAKELNLWLVAPPPHAVGGRRIGPEHEPVLAWDLGASLAGPELEATRELAKGVRESDAARRPLVCSPRAKIWQYSRLADISVFAMPSLHGTAEFDEAGARLRDNQGLARPGAPCWAAIDSETPEEIRAQLDAISPGSGQRARIDPRQLRLLAIEAVAAGARGIYFRSSSRLIEGDARSLALKLANLDLALIEPWMAGGQSAGVLAAGEIAAGEATTHVRVMRTDRSELLLVTPVARHQQYELAPLRERETAFVVAGAPRASRAYVVSPTGLKTLPDTRRVAGGIRVVLPSERFLTMVVLTGDDHVTAHLQRRVAEHAEEAARALRLAAQDGLGFVEETDRELTQLGLVQNDSQERLTEARTFLRSCDRLLDGGDFGGAQEEAERALDALAPLRRARWTAASERFASPVASPCSVCFGALPTHWRLAARLKTLRWSENVLPAGDFESLPQLQSTGWRHYRGADCPLETEVLLTSTAARAGGSGLVLRAADSANAGASAAERLVESPPVWITSAPIAVKAGQMVRVKGWYRLPAPIEGSRDGALLFDSIGGLPMALRAVEAGEWREVTFYRAAPADGEFAITLALTGRGEAWFDDFSVSVLASGSQ